MEKTKEVIEKNSTAIIGDHMFTSPNGEPFCVVIYMNKGMTCGMNKCCGESRIITIEAIHWTTLLYKSITSVGESGRVTQVRNEYVNNDYTIGEPKW